MKERQITSANADGQIRLLYECAFPEEERIPWDDLMTLVGEMSLDFTAYYDDVEQTEQDPAFLDLEESRRNTAEGRFIGFTIIYPRKAFNWYWYFAVCEELRGKGYGQQILTKVKEHYKGQTSIFDMESPRQECDNIVQRRRRHEFYLRNGFRDTNLYRTYENVEMTIMMIGPGKFTMQDWDDIVCELRQHWTWDD